MRLGWTGSRLIPSSFVIGLFPDVSFSFTKSRKCYRIDNRERAELCKTIEIRAQHCRVNDEIVWHPVDSGEGHSEA